MIATLIFGFFLGMRHALEADHLAAVASLATRTGSLKDGLKLGSLWGLGHTLTLFLFGTVVLLTDSLIPERLAQVLELCVGFMLLAMGASVLVALVRRRIHIHLHRHGGGDPHIHFHSHAGEEDAHDPQHHAHFHPARGFFAPVLVGMMHGMAGSAALIVLALQATPSLATGLFYILLFGVGSTLGMAVLSLAVVLPLRRSERALNRMHHALKGTIGAATLALGVWVIHDIGWVQGLLG